MKRKITCFAAALACAATLSNAQAATLPTASEASVHTTTIVHSNARFDAIWRKLCERYGIPSGDESQKPGGNNGGSHNNSGNSGNNNSNGNGNSNNGSHDNSGSNGGNDSNSGGNGGSNNNGNNGSNGGSNNNGNNGGSNNGGSGGTNDSGTSNSTYASQVASLVNTQRAQAGLPALTLDASMSRAAQTRANELRQSFSHTRPNGARGLTALSEAGVSYRAAGENIAYGQSTPSAVMNAWMNSSGHRANILSSSYGRIGVGYVNIGGTAYWVQLFAD